MTLQAPDDRLEKVGQGIVDTTERYRGYVLSSSLGTGEDEGGGTYELRVPAADLRDALRDLGRLGTVRSQSQSGQDVTAGYVSAADRLQSARAERRSLLRRLERSGTDTQSRGAAPPAGPERPAGVGPARPARATCGCAPTTRPSRSR